MYLDICNGLQMLAVFVHKTLDDTIVEAYATAPSHSNVMSINIVHVQKN